MYQSREISDGAQLEIARLLKTYRQARALTQEDLADRCHLGKAGNTLISHLENASTRPSLTRPVALALDEILRFGHPEGNDRLQEEDHFTWYRITRLDEPYQRIQRRKDDWTGSTRFYHHLIALADQLLELKRPSSYILKWFGARWYHLTCDFSTALPLLDSAVREAMVDDSADPALLGLILHDKADALINHGQLDLAKSAAKLSRAQYDLVLQRRRRSDAIPELGIERARILELQVAVWDGTAINACMDIFKDVEQRAGLIRDLYGLFKANYFIGYLHFLEEEFEKALDYALKALDYGSKSITPLSDPYWLLRDGRGLKHGKGVSNTWARLHSLALIADTTSRAGEKASPTRVPEQADSLKSESFKVWWSSQMPPVYPLYYWDMPDLLSARARQNHTPAEVIDNLRKAGIHPFVPLAMLAYADFVTKGHRVVESADNLRREARSDALSHGFMRIAGLAERRESRSN